MDALHDVASLWLQPAFSLWGSPITWTELLACGLSLWMVGCNMRVHPLGWPLAIVSSLLYAALFLHYRLYGEASLQLVFVALAGWAQHVMTFQGGAVELLSHVNWVFKLHMVLGMSVFLIFPFTRLVHVWSGFASATYALRPYQVVRSRKLNLPADHLTPDRHVGH